MGDELSLVLRLWEDDDCLDEVEEEEVETDELAEEVVVVVLQVENAGQELGLVAVVTELEVSRVSSSRKDRLKSGGIHVEDKIDIQIYIRSLKLSINTFLAGIISFFFFLAKFVVILILRQHSSDFEDTHARKGSVCGKLAKGIVGVVNNLVAILVPIEPQNS